MNDASFFALLDSVERAVRDKSAVSRTALMAALAAGVYPKDAVWSALRLFEGAFYKTLADAYSKVLDTTFGIQKIKALPVSGLALSTNLYGMQRAVSDEVLSIITRHTKGMMEGRALAMSIYEGYGFKDGTDPLKLTPANKTLPKYLREVLRDNEVRTQMARVIARGQVSSLKTPALRAAYMQALDEVENGAGTARLDKVMKVALEERQRYYANRISQTELARAYSDEKAREFMGDPSLTVLQWRMSATHPKVDICDMHANLDKYRLGPGCYPKEVAPKPPAHPHCRCILAPRWDLNADKAKARAKAEQVFLIEAGDKDGAKIMGSADKWQKAKSGKATVENILNAGKDPLYHLARVGDVV
jgi:hypothetical protein